MAQVLEEQTYDFTNIGITSNLNECIHEIDLVQNDTIIKTYLSYLDSDPYQRVSDKTLVMIPGIGSSVKFFKNNFDYFIQRRYRVVAIDLLGFGNSDTPDIEYNEITMPAVIADLIIALDLEDIFLFGTSLGATISLGLQEIIPNRISKLILNAPPGFGREVLNSLKIISLPIIGKFLLKINMNPIVAKIPIAQKSYWKSVFANTEIVDDDLKDLYYEVNKNTRSAIAYSKIIRNYVGIRGLNNGLCERIQNTSQNIQIPTLLIWGMKDNVIPFEQAKRAAGCIPNSLLIGLEECGHMPYVEYPFVFNDAINYFVSLKI